MSRRAALSTFGGAGVAVLTACRGEEAGAPTDERAPNDSSALSCVVTPDVAVGPFYVDEKLERSDLTLGTREPFVTSGVPLYLRLGVVSVAGGRCTAIEGAQVDVWHASAEGVYSDEPSSTIQSKGTVGERYLRGHQLTDASGFVEFKTIYPGWYVNRTIHIHLTVRILSAGKILEFTSQLYIDDAINDVVMASGAYATRGARDVRNSNDVLYGVNGPELVLGLEPRSGGGYTGTYTIGLRT